MIHIFDLQVSMAIIAALMYSYYNKLYLNKFYLYPVMEWQ
jgi:hypothetical protein